MPERMTLDVDILVKAEDAQLVYEYLAIAKGQRLGNLSIAGTSVATRVDGTSLVVLAFDGDWVVDAAILIRDLHKIIDPKNIAAVYAHRYIFGFYMDHFFFGVPLCLLICLSRQILNEGIGFSKITIANNHNSCY